jgi:hypothetical protein
MAEEDEFEESAAPSSGPGVVAVAMPMLTAVIALGAGLLVGGLATWVLLGFREPEIQIQQVKRELTPEELAAACAPLAEPLKTELDQVNERVLGLQTRVVDKEREIAELEAEMKRRGAKGAEMARQLESAKKELASLQTRLDLAEKEKEALQVELTETKVALADQKVRTHLAKEDALDYKWRDFVGLAQLEICERGNRKKLGQCRETVQANLGGLWRDKFAHCVRSGQAVPSVRELQKAEVLPPYSQFINEEDKRTKGWFVMLCDPTLPELADWREGAEAPAPSKPAGEPWPEIGDLD